MKPELYTSTHQSPLGNLLIASSIRGIICLEFLDDEQEMIQKIEKLGDFEVVHELNSHISACKDQLDAYFAKELRVFDLPLDLHGTDFQQRVWKELLSVPYGSTRTYKEQALALGDIKAIRAVAKANGDNKIAIVVPCHRIIGSDQSLTGYAGGLWRKRALLELESNQGSLF